MRAVLPAGRTLRVAPNSTTSLKPVLAVGPPGPPGPIGHPGPAGPGTGAGATLGAVLLSDTFARSDRDLDEDVADTGQQWTKNRPEAEGVHLITDHAYVAQSVPGFGDVLRSFLSAPFQSVTSDFFFIAGDTGAQNMVLGSAGATFYDEDDVLTTSGGFGTGSVQLDIAPRLHSVETAPDVFNDVHWRLFNVQHPNILPYPVIMWGVFDNDLLEDGTVYRAGMWYDDANRQITVQLPDGSSRTTSGTGDEADLMETASKYWGRMVGIQCRRPTRIDVDDPDDPGSDGYVGFLRVAVHGVNVSKQQPVAAAIPRFGSGLAAIRFPAGRDSDSELRTITDLITVANVTLDQWTGVTDGQTFMAQWGRTGQHSWDWDIDVNSKLRMLPSQDGTLNDGSSVASVATGFADGSTHWIAAYRTASDGATRFYYSDQAPETARSSVTWTQIGTPVAGVAGAPFTAAARVEIGIRGRANPMYGNVRFAGAYTATGGTSGTSIATALAGATVLQESDHRGTWTGLSTTGDRGVAESLSFVATQASVDGLPAKITAYDAMVTAVAARSVVLARALPIPVAATVVNTTTETTLFSMTIPAANVAVNDVIELTYVADWLNNSGADTTIRWRWKIGSTTVFDFTVSAVTAGANRRHPSGTLEVTLAALDDLRCDLRHDGSGAASNQATLTTTATARGTRQVTTENLGTDTTMAVTVQFGNAASTIDARLLAAVLTRKAR